MNWATHCAAVIPCFNEAQNIGRVIQSVRQVVRMVLVIDDGSTDNTGEIAKDFGAEVLRHPFSQGKGAALRSGWERARQSGFAWALTLDGDGQHSANDIDKFFLAAERTGADLIVGNRMHNAVAMPPLRRFVNRWMSRRISALAGISLPDSQCGFRLMNLKTWSKLPIAAAQFEIESDVLLAFARRACGIEFVPIEVIYKGEQSKIRPLGDTVRWMRWWRRARRDREILLALKRENMVPVYER